ncbi:hypothetical protein JCGZ_13470 [Jatropha curcas]|uniref:CCHC-type domain-containing protein n=1 Tax=Jatropha curcas TaxID=180498 RepID=A0A067LNH1_JATCU|nr:hypothetical protein JCGZ_13470 [Jatropha curcas]
MPAASVVASSTSGSRGSGRGSGRGTGRGADSAGYTSSPCEHCGRRHGGDCWLVTGKCWTCGASDHQKKDCPKRARVPTPFLAGRGRGETSGVQRQQSETVDRPDTRAQLDSKEEEIHMLRTHLDEQERQLADLREHVMRMSGPPVALASKDPHASSDALAPSIIVPAHGSAAAPTPDTGRHLSDTHANPPADPFSPDTDTLATQP